MRHRSLKVSLLTGGVVVPAALGLLVLGTGTAQGIPTSQSRTGPAVLVAVVTLLADLDQVATSSTAKQAIRVLHLRIQMQQRLWTPPVTWRTLQDGTIAPSPRCPGGPGLHTPGLHLPNSRRGLSHIGRPGGLTASRGSTDLGWGRRNGMDQAAGGVPLQLGGRLLMYEQGGGEPRYSPDARGF